jgi:hypothetical protein
MATFTTSRQQSARHGVPDTQDTAVVNVRRGNRVPAEIVPEPERAAPLGLDDAPPPPTVLRLPDLAAAVKTVRTLGSRIRVGSIAQWAAIGVGAALALWLIFGGRAPQPAADEAPAWSAGESPPADAPPAWHGLNNSAASASPPADPDAAGAPEWNPPNAPAEGDFDPYQQMQPGDGDEYSPDAPSAGPQWDDSSQAPAASGPANAPLHTARRPDAPATPSADRFQPSEAEPLDITVPVPQ